MNETLQWQKSSHPPSPFVWVCPGNVDRPTIWAGKASNGKWLVQFAYGQYGQKATGKTRAEASVNLISQWESMGKKSVYA